MVYKAQNFISLSSEIETEHRVGKLGALFTEGSGSHMMTILLCPHKVEVERQLSEFTFILGLPIHLVTSQIITLPNTIIPGLGFPHMKFGGTQNLDHNVIVVEGVAGTIGTQPHQVLVV